MPYDEKLAARIRRKLTGRKDVVEKKMFGGLAFMVRGHMAFGVVKQDLMVRVGADNWEAALARPHARPLDFTGKPRKGMVFVGPAGTRDAAVLGRWLRLALAHTDSLPAKP